MTWARSDGGVEKRVRRSGSTRRSKEVRVAEGVKCREMRRETRESGSTRRSEGARGAEEVKRKEMSEKQATASGAGSDVQVLTRLSNQGVLSDYLRYLVQLR